MIMTAKKMIALFLSFAILFTCGIRSVSAETITKDNSSDADAQQERAVILPSIVVDGTALTLHSSISITKAYNLLVARTGFLKSDFRTAPNSSNLYISGCINHSVTGDTIYDHLIRVGIGYYSGGSLIPAFTDYVDRGIGFTRQLCRISNLTATTTNYLFAENYFSSGYIYGDLGLYYVRP